MRGVELGELTECAVDEVSPVGQVLGLNVDLDRRPKILRRLREGPEDGLRPEHQELRVSRHSASRANRVFELFALRVSAASPSRP